MAAEREGQEVPSTGIDQSRRWLLQAAALIGVSGLTFANNAPDRALTSDGGWFDLALYIARALGKEGRATWYTADFAQVIAARRQSGQLAATYQPHPSTWYSAVHDRSWIGDQLVALNPDTKRYAVVDVIDVMSNPNAVVDLSAGAFEELGVPRSAGVQRVWIFRLPRPPV